MKNTNNNTMFNLKYIGGDYKGRCVKLIKILNENYIGYSDNKNNFFVISLKEDFFIKASHSMTGFVKIYTKKFNQEEILQPILKIKLDSLVDNFW